MEGRNGDHLNHIRGKGERKCEISGLDFYDDDMGYVCTDYEIDSQNVCHRVRREKEDRKIVLFCQEFQEYFAHSST